MLSVPHIGGRFQEVELAQDDAMVGPFTRHVVETIGERVSFDSLDEVNDFTEMERLYTLGLGGCRLVRRGVEYDSDCL